MRPHRSPTGVEPINLDTTSFFHNPAAQEALRIISRLRQAGFVAYMAGGCVRDALLGIAPKDYDVATNATPNSVRQLFGKSRTLAFGASFGVIGVLPERSNRSSKVPIEPTEVATFRSDGEYSDGRRPDSVHYGNADQDALRRDFTINGLFFDPQADEVIDYVGGQADLAAQLIRTIGPPSQRFDEDKLRMLRAVRFATTMGFRIDDPTMQAIRCYADEIAVVSGERIGAEMRRVLVSASAAVGIEHLIACGLQRVVLPEVENTDLQRFEKLLKHLSRRDFPVVLACLMLVLTSPETSLAAIAERWKLSNEEIRQALSAWKHWPVVADADQRAWSAVQPVLVDRDAETIVTVAEAVVRADAANEAGISLARNAMSAPIETLDPEPLLTGHDLQQLQIPKGPHYRQILQRVRDAQLDGEIRSKQEATALAKAFPLP